MSEPSDTTLNVYEEDLTDDTTQDFSSLDLETAPELKSSSIVVLYLQNNKLRTLPDDFFPSLPCLMYLDLRDNRLTDIPKSIMNHQALTHLLVQNNCLTSLPDELGTVNLKVLQLNGNPLMYPPREVINAGVNKTLTFLHCKYIDSLTAESHTDISDENSTDRKECKIPSPEALSYNSVIDEDKIKNNLLVKLNEKDYDDSDEEYYAKIKGKCPKLDKSRHRNLPRYYQSAKYLRPLLADDKMTREEKIKQNYLKDLAIMKRKDLLASREKILQEKKNIELLKNWRKNYRYGQYFNRDPSYRLEAKDYPYDTSPEYMTLLTREDIEKDLPDKYRKTLVRRSRPSVPRKRNNDVHLAMKIKKLFENLEAIDLNRDTMTPRTEQKVLLNEIHKITEIQQKLQELSSSNMHSVISEI